MLFFSVIHITDSRDITIKVGHKRLTTVHSISISYLWEKLVWTYGRNHILWSDDCDEWPDMKMENTKNTNKYIKMKL